MLSARTVFEENFDNDEVFRLFGSSVLAGDQGSVDGERRFAS
jgi:hypothetical protein